MLVLACTLSGTQCKIDNGTSVFTLHLLWTEIIGDQYLGRCLRTSTGVAPVKPFRLLKWVPRNVYLILQHSWRPIFDLMENAPEMNIPANWSDITPEVLNSTYTKGIEYVQQQVGYIWNHEEFSKKDISKWSTATWSKYVKRSSVLKHGTPEDIANSDAAIASRKNKRQRTLAMPSE